MSNRHKSVVIVCFAGVMSLFGLGRLKAETDNEASRQNLYGKSFTTKSVLLSNSVPTVILSSNNARADGTCFNNSNVYIFLSTGMAGTTAQNGGFPIPSSTTFSMHGYSGGMWATLPANGQGEVRCYEGTIP